MILNHKIEELYFQYLINNAIRLTRFIEIKSYFFGI